MKKIIGVLAVFTFSVVMFSNTDTENQSNQDTSLSNLLQLNSANAECTPSGSSSANAFCTASGRCRYDTTTRDCHL
ncbi:hypothetical protein [Flavobacterium chungangense]|uniref:Uncharacterized protein n=1 Tax=Flavobacterium chungangense TaxID=554283 RepID=A0A6V6ZFG3_9FLAO|nr:hypothetical protein [Flavobacterium chungangense]CAD0009622.1 hypothetical protein FLACHUCJ7_04315 [Flavobacterium chungangense]